MRKALTILAGLLVAASAFGQQDYQRHVYIGNSSGNGIGVDTATRALEAISYPHHEKHAGSSYHAGQFDLDLDTGETNGVIIIVANTTKWPHLTMTAENTVAANGFVYRGVTLTATGAVITAFNDDHNSTNTAGMAVYEWTGSTNSGLGTMVDEHLFGAAGPGNFGTGGAAERPEVILKQNTVYAIIMVGVADNGRMNLDLSWYEHTNKTD